MRKWPTSDMITTSIPYLSTTAAFVGNSVELINRTGAGSAASAADRLVEGQSSVLRNTSIPASGAADAIYSTIQLLSSGSDVRTNIAAETSSRMAPAKSFSKRATERWTASCVMLRASRSWSVSTPTNPITFCAAIRAPSTITGPPIECPIRTTRSSWRKSMTATTSWPNPEIVQSSRLRPDSPCPARSRATTRWYWAEYSSCPLQ